MKYLGLFIFAIGIGTAGAASNLPMTLTNPPEKLQPGSKPLYDGRNFYWYVMSTRSLVEAREDEKRREPNEIAKNAVQFTPVKDKSNNRLEFIVKNLNDDPLQTSVTLYYLGAGRGMATRRTSTDQQGRCIFKDKRLVCNVDGKEVKLPPHMFSVGRETDGQTSGTVYFSVVPRPDYKMDMGGFNLPDGIFTIKLDARRLALSKRDRPRLQNVKPRNH